MIGLNGEIMTDKKSLTKNKKNLKIKFRSKLSSEPATLKPELSASFFLNAKAVLRVAGSQCKVNS
jgi:hypothetical protein